ncbi:hypothetical protein SALB_01624 [Streptomyces noursei]|uniref:Uncharacterized protein n=2 Tax=Streptomyces noursei TaxID=1971 RepID=A0A401QU61_STRNR|nr:hypothetical protein SALB_01624 [Streptomyces noursei]
MRQRLTTGTRAPAVPTPRSRRWMLTVLAGAPLIASCGGKEPGGAAGPQDGPGGKGRDSVADGPAGVLGANFNEDPSDVTFPALEALSASWLRGFVPMSDIDGAVSAQPAVRTLLAARAKGYGTVLSMKFQNVHRPIPSPGSQAMSDELARMERLLDVVMGNVNILTIGNEPFLETREADRNARLNAFYEKAAEHVIAYRRKKFPSGCTTRLYMGALNHLDRPGGQTAATERWMAFVKQTREIEGVDIHPHVDSAEAAQKYVDYVLPRLRADQRFLVTEFSLVLLWEKHMGGTVPAPFARRYGMPADLKVWQLLKQAVAHPVPAQQWRDFLTMSPWYASHQHFLRNQVDRFRSTGRLAVATYGVAQAAAMVRDLGPEKQPWLLNSLYANRTVQHSGSGELPHNYPVFDDFRALQRSVDHRPVRLGKTST